VFEALCEEEIFGSPQKRELDGQELMPLVGVLKCKMEPFKPREHTWGNC